MLVVCLSQEGSVGLEWELGEEGSPSSWNHFSRVELLSLCWSKVGRVALVSQTLAALIRI